MEQCKTAHLTDVFHLRPAKQDREVEKDDAEQPDYVALSEEDNILYAEGEEVSVDDATTLLFIHQSELNCKYSRGHIERVKVLN